MVSVFRPPGRILAFFGGGRNLYISTPNFEMYLTKLVGTIQVTKKLPILITEMVPAGITEKRPFLRFAEKRKTGRKSVFFQKNFRNLLKD